MAKDDQGPVFDPAEEERARQRLQEMFQGIRFGPVAAAPPESETDEDDEDAATAALRCVREFSFRPREIRDHLDRFVIRQNEAKKVLSVAICDHYNRARACLEHPDLRDQEYMKQNVVLLGPTGVGKTYLMRCIARLIGVPFVKADATKFSETGYVGHDVEDIVRDLVRVADGNTELAQYGIIYIDEIDKIASRGGDGGKDVSGRGVQINLLKLMEETDVNLHSQTDLIGQMEAMMQMMHGGGKRERTINTRHMLFIVSGAFDRLVEIVARRVKGVQIGFGQGGGAAAEHNELLTQVETADLIKFGFEPEFVGRLPVRVACRALDAADLAAIMLRSEGSILAQYRRDFAGYGIHFTLHPEAVDRVAAMAAAEKTGARGLMTVLERVLRDFKFELPSTTIREFDVREQTITEPAQALAALLGRDMEEQHSALRTDVQQFADRFAAEHGLELVFTDAAVTAVVNAGLACGKTIRGLCEERFRDFHFGLKLVARNTGRTSFRIDERVVADPEAAISGWVVASYEVSDAGDATEA